MVGDGLGRDDLARTAPPVGLTALYPMPSTIVSIAENDGIVILASPFGCPAFVRCCLVRRFIMNLC